MLYNKNSVRKTNDKKILHKVGKQWKVISVALLMAIGGGAAVAATNNTSANADANNGVTAATSAEANSLEAMDNYANPYAKPASKSVAPSASAKAPSFENINYAPSARVDGNNASAASYKNNENFDKANMNYYGPIVKSYVNSINARFPQARSLATSYQAASGKAANANSLEGSYSATAKASATANEISARAARVGQTASYYTDSVAYAVLGNGNNNGYINDVSNAASLATQESAVASGASLVSAIDASPLLQNEYHDKYELAKASANADKAYYNDEKEIAKDIASNSSINMTNLNSARTRLSGYAINARIAGINSAVDASAVNSIAASAGFSFSSSVVSSAVSVLANNYNDATAANTDNLNVWSNASYNANGSEVKPANNGVLVFSASNQASNGKSAVSVEVLSNASELSSAMTGDSYAKSASDYASASTAMDFLRVVSDTAAQQSYAQFAGSLENEISKDQAAVSTYSEEVSSAESAANSAAVVYSESASVANADAYLGNGKPSLGAIFGTTSASFVNFTDVTDEIGASVKPNSSISNSSDASKASTAVSQTNTDVANAITGLKGINNTSAFSNAMSIAQSYISNGRMSSLVNKFAGVLASTSSNAMSGVVNGIFASVNKRANKDNNADFSAELSNIASSATNDINSLNASHEFTGNNGYLNALVNAFGNNGALNNAINNYASSNGSYTVNVPVNGLFDANSSDNNNYSAAEAALHFPANITSDQVSSATKSIASAANNAASSYNSLSSESASYSNATDQDVTIASQFANYYGSVASSDANQASNAKNSLDQFYGTHAANQSEFNNASAVYTSASNAEPNDADLAHAFGINVLNYSPKYIVLDHNAMLHSDPNYTKSNGVEAVKAGATFTVKGVGFDKVGNIRYEVSAKNGKPAFVTANDYYVENAYLEPGETYDVTLSHAAREHTDLNYGKGKAVKTAAKGTTFKDVTAVRADGNYEGITRLQLANGNYITANKYYLTDVSTVANNSNNGSNVQYGRVTF